MLVAYLTYSRFIDSLHSSRLLEPKSLQVIYYYAKSADAQNPERQPVGRIQLTAATEVERDSHTLSIKAVKKSGAPGRVWKLSADGADRVDKWEYGVRTCCTVEVNTLCIRECGGNRRGRWHECRRNRSVRNRERLHSPLSHKAVLFIPTLTGSPDDRHHDPVRFHLNTRGCSLLLGPYSPTDQ
jgi:hypothetical protein